MSLAADLAARLNGTLRAESLIIIQDGDQVSIVDATPTGKVVLMTPGGGLYQLGKMSDGLEHLAAMFYAATAEVPC